MASEHKPLFDMCKEIKKITSCEEIDNFEVSEDVNGSLKSLLKSLIKVQSKYLIYTNYEGELIDGLERVFAYEFYRQWANNIEGNNILCNFTINGEILKNQGKFFGSLNKNTFPDMVMHSGDGSTYMQEIVCEIKRKEGVDKKTLMEDFAKLWHFTGFEIPFRFGVFILVGEKLEWLLKKDYSDTIKDYFSKQPDLNIENLNRLICVSYINNHFDDKEGEIEICRLSNLFNLIGNNGQENVNQ